MPVLRRVVPVLSFLLVPLWATAVRAECPNGSFSCYGSGASSGETTADPVASFDCSRFHVDSHLSFDHIQGLVSAQSVSVPGNTASAYLSDNFVLTGPPAGTLVPITVVGDFDLQNIRQVNAVTWSSGSIFTPLLSGSGPIPNTAEVFFTASAPGTETITQQVRLDMNVKAGQEFEIGFKATAQASGNAGGYSHGRLSFAGLPPGSSITACKGFRQDQPVPALPVSWGGLKATYR